MFKTLGSFLVEGFQDHVWGPGLDLMPHWGPFLHAILLLLVLGAIIAGVGFVIHLIHCRSYACDVTRPFWKHWSICGAVFAVMSLIRPKGGWSVGCHVVFCLLLAFVGVLVAKAVAETSTEDHPRWVYAVRAVIYGLAFFLLGFYGALVCCTAILMLVALAIAGAVCLGAMKSEVHSRHSRSVDTNTKYRLGDGTVVEQWGETWHATGFSSKEYVRNDDGSFSQIN